MVKPATDLAPGFKMTELGPLPEEWEVVELKWFCKVISGFAFKSKDFSKTGIPVVKIGNLQNSTIVIDKRTSYLPPNKYNESMAKYVLEEGDVLIALTGATTGKIGVVPPSFKGALLNQRVGKIELQDKKGFFLDYGRYYFSTKIFQEEIHGNILKSAQGNVNPKRIEMIPIPLPPLPEQRAIAQVLRTVQRAREATEAVIETAARLKRSLMRHLFTYGPVPVDQAEQVKLKDTEIGSVPEEWEIVKIENLIKDRSVFAKAGFPQGVHNQSGNGVPHLRPFNVSSGGKIDLTLIKYIDPPSEGSPYWLHPGDVIFNNTNSEELVGKTAYFDLCGRFVLSNHMTLIRVINEEMIDAKHLAQQLHYMWMKDEFKKVCRRHVNQSSVSLTRLKAVRLPLPPLPEQREIAEILSVVDRKIETEQARKAALDNLFATLLANLMTGKIRVKVKKKIKQKE